MLRRLWSCLLAFALSAAAVALAPSPALAADFTYRQGETVRLGFGSLSSQYTVYWWSDRDGYFYQGNPLVSASMSVGVHSVAGLIYRGQTLVYRADVTVEIKSATTTTPSTGSSTSPGVSATSVPGEFEPVSEMLLGTADAYLVDGLYAEMIQGIRGAGAKTTIYVDNSYVRYDLEDTFASYGLSSADYRFVTLPLDSIWMRDYGPLFVKNQGKLEVVDLDYYDERPTDDVFPQRFAQERSLTRRSARLYWEGGNFTADGRGGIYKSDRVYSQNGLTRAQVDQRASAAFLNATVTTLEEMLDDGGTGHMDMFCLFTGARTALVNRFASGHQNAARMDRNARLLEQRGFTVKRLDLADTRFKSYTNGLIVNGVALVPTFNSATKDAAALQAYRDAGFRAVGIDCRRIIEWSGAIHCITITVPK